MLKIGEVVTDVPFDFEAPRNLGMKSIVNDPALDTSLPSFANHLQVVVKQDDLKPHLFGQGFDHARRKIIGHLKETGQRVERFGEGMAAADSLGIDERLAFRMLGMGSQQAPHKNPSIEVIHNRV